MYSSGIAYLLWFLSGFGAIGLHRFYLGKYISGFVWMFTGGLGMFGSIYDFLTLPGQVQEANMRKALMSGQTRNMYFYQDAPKSGPETVNVTPKERLEHIILRIAKHNNGITTAGEVALEADIELTQAKDSLEKLVEKGFAELRVKRSGGLVYVFPEFCKDDSDLEGAF